jgi:hypothetical protein
MNIKTRSRQKKGTNWSPATWLFKSYIYSFSPRNVLLTDCDFRTSSICTLSPLEGSSFRFAYTHHVSLCPYSHPSLLWSHIQIPINLTLITISLFQPLIRLLKMPIIQEPPMSTERTRVSTLQHQVLAAIDTLHPKFRRFAPSQKHHTLCTLRSHSVDDFLCELLPALLGVRVGFVGADG